jgi:hypothetical protein
MSLADERTTDLQHDLAMAYASHKQDALVQAIEAELCTRGAPLPRNARWVYDLYAHGKRRLRYDLQDGETHHE